MTTSQNWLIAGANGLIGQQVAHGLIADGHRVVGLGRQPESRIQKRFAGISWINRLGDCTLEPGHEQNLAGETKADHR